MLAILFGCGLRRSELVATKKLALLAVLLGGWLAGYTPALAQAPCLGKIRACRPRNLFSEPTGLPSSPRAVYRPICSPSFEYPVGLRREGQRYTTQTEISLFRWRGGWLSGLHLLKLSLEGQKSFTHMLYFVDYLCENLRWIAGVAHGSTRLLFLREGVRCATAHCSVGRLGRGGSWGRPKQEHYTTRFPVGGPSTDRCWRGLFFSPRGAERLALLTGCLQQHGKPGTC